MSELFKKDQAQISLPLRSATLSGTVTDADLLCFYGMLFLEADERKQLERRGAKSLLSTVQQRQQQMVAELEATALQALRQEKPTLPESEAIAQAKQTAATLFDQELGEAIFFKVNNNHLLRLEFVSRVLEIFPGIDQSLVDYDPQRAIGRCRLTAQETMSLVMTVLGGLMGLVYEEAKPVATANGSSQVKNAPVAEGSAIALVPEVMPDENPFGLSPEVLAVLSPEAKVKLGLV